MKIANPIYDVVFRYLMDDQRIAKLLISKIIGEDIESIEFQPTGNVVPVDRAAKDKVSFTVYRLDFCAKIRAANGEMKTVIIEIQKAKLPTDIMRFRKYLGKQYMSESNSEKISETSNKRKAFSIISIYFLGHQLEHNTAPVIKVSRPYTDLATGEILKEKEEFIESLSHDSYVIQIPSLEGKRRSDLEKLLSIFDQSQRENDHILNVREEDYPTEYHDIIRKLQHAIVDEEIQNSMDIEDEIIEELGNREREIENLKDAISKKDNMISEQGNMLSEKDNLLSEKDNMLSEKDNEISEKDKEIERLRQLLEGKS